MPRNGTGQKLANRPVPGQPYGEATRQAEAMRVAPRASADLNVPTPTVPATMAQRLQPDHAPGDLPFLDVTRRPQEPITSGLPIGPGAGPEGLAGSPTNTLGDELQMLASGPDATPEIRLLAATARVVGM